MADKNNVKEVNIPEKFETVEIGKTQLEFFTSDDVINIITKSAEKIEAVNSKLAVNLNSLRKELSVIKKNYPSEEKNVPLQGYRLINEALYNTFGKDKWKSVAETKGMEDIKEILYLLEKFIAGSHLGQEGERGRGTPLTEDDLKKYEELIVRILEEKASTKPLTMDVVEKINKEKSHVGGIVNRNTARDKQLNELGGEYAEYAKKESEESRLRLENWKTELLAQFKNNVNKIIEEGTKEFAGGNKIQKEGAPGRKLHKLGWAETNPVNPIGPEEKTPFRLKDKEPTVQNKKPKTRAKSEIEAEKQAKSEAEEKSEITRLEPIFRSFFDRFSGDERRGDFAKEIFAFKEENPDAINYEFLDKIVKSIPKLNEVLTKKGATESSGNVRKFETQFKEALQREMENYVTKKNASKKEPIITIPDATIIPSEAVVNLPDNIQPSSSGGMSTLPIDIEGMMSNMLGRLENSISQMFSEIGSTFGNGLKGLMNELIDQISSSGPSGSSKTKSGNITSVPEMTPEETKTTGPTKRKSKPGIPLGMEGFSLPDFSDAFRLMGYEFLQNDPDIMRIASPLDSQSEPKMEKDLGDLFDKLVEAGQRLLNFINESIPTMVAQGPPQKIVDEGGNVTYKEARANKPLGGTIKSIFSISDEDRKEAKSGGGAVGAIGTASSFIKGAKSDPLGTFGAMGSKITEGMTSGGEKPGMLAKGVGGMVSGIGIVISLIKKLTESSPILKAVLELFNLAFTLIMMPFGNMIGEWLLPLAIKMIDYAVAFNEIFPRIREFFGAIGSWIVNLPGRIVSGIKDFAEKIVERLMNNLDIIFGVLSSAKDYIFSLPKKIWESFLSIRAKLIDMLKDVLNSVLSGITNITGGITDSIKGVFGFAGGGYVPASPSGSLHIVGEGTRGEYIIPEGSPMLQGNGGTIINITFTGNVYGMNDFESQVTTIVNKVSNKAFYR